MIQRVELDQFKAFERFALYLRGDAYLAGPNNAGKSTVIAAVRTAAKMLRYASRRVATYSVLDKGNRVLAHPFGPDHFGLVEENLRHEFHDLEARMSIRFNNGVTLTAAWPPDLEAVESFFYLIDGDIALTSPRDVIRSVPTVGIVPVLSPIEHQEAVLTSEKYTRENLDGRLASRHFRNQLLLLDREPPEENYEAFLTFAEPWIPELSIEHVKSRMDRGGVYLDLFYREDGSRIEKECFWVGDGLQIWLQVLLHVFRLRHLDVMLLDEPDVFLHPDLQRRLVRLLESLDAQIITATHSPELLAEAPPEAVVWVDKTRRRSVRAPDSSVLADLMTAIGTQFNIRLARALRAKQVLFVEGDDMKVLRHLAEAVGAINVAREVGIAVIPLRGYSNWDRIEPFVWLIRDLLQESVEVFVVLDRDYRSSDQIQSVQERLGGIGVKVHVWKRKELENYLLEPQVISRVLKTTERDAMRRLDAASVDLKDHVIGRAVYERTRNTPPKQKPKIQKDVEDRLEELWMDSRRRLAECPPKMVLARINQQLEKEGLKAITFQRIARTMRADDVPHEVKILLLKVEGPKE